MTPAVKAQLAAMLRDKLKLVAPAEHIDEIVDLAVHAAAEGIRAAMNVLDRASDPRITICAAGPALGFLEGLAKQRIQIMREQAAAEGHPVYAFPVNP